MRGQIWTHPPLYYLCNVSVIPGAKTIFQLAKSKNMLKIENCCCHGNGGEDKKIYAFLFITRQKLKAGKVSGKSIFSSPESLDSLVCL